MEKQEIFDILKATGAMLEGHFLLSSGLHSNRYFQCAKALEMPENAQKLVAGLVKNIKLDINDIDVVVGPALGGVVVGYELARQLNKRSIFAERENNEMTLRRGFEINKGEKVLICEDVITTGKSILEVKKVLEEKGAEVVAFASLINRTNGNVDFGVPYYYLLEVEAVAYKPEECPLCKDPNIGEPYKPGSRKI